jgi:ATP synthase protein I
MRTVLRGQLAVTILAGSAASAFIGSDAALSAVLGGAVSVVAGLAFLWVASRSLSTRAGAGAALVGMLRAEAVKILVIVALLWLVLANVPRVVPAVFIATFVASVLIQSLALLVRES